MLIQRVPIIDDIRSNVLAIQREIDCRQTKALCAEKNERMYYITLYMFWIELLAGEAIRKMRLPNELYAVSSSLLVALKWLVCSFYLGDSPEKWPTGPVRLPTRIREFSSKSNVHIWWNFSPGKNICHNKIIQILLFFFNLNFDGFQMLKQDLPFLFGCFQLFND